jgi:GAF domain-containing protein/HAMP domain-containing protein
MRTRLNPLKILSWPIWVKLLIGFGLTPVLLALPAGLLIRAGIYEVGLQSARTFVTQNGTHQVNAITNALVGASNNLDEFIGNPATQRQLTGLLLGPVRTGIELNYPTPRRDEIETLFTSTLLNPATSIFENARLLDRNGLVVARAGLTSSGRGVAARDESDSPAYLAAVAARLQGATRILNLSFANDAVVEYVHVLEWRDGNPLGFLAVRINNTRAIYGNLRFTDDTYQGLTYLADAQGAVISDQDGVGTSTVVNADIVARALTGQSNAETYTLPDNKLVIGYFGPVRGTPLALVTQVDTNVAFERALDFFNIRIFVVAIGVLGLLGIVVLLFNQMLTPPLIRLRRSTQQFSEGHFDVAISDTERGDEIGELANAFAVMREAVRDLVEDLETRIAARARDISTTQEISRFAATQRSLQVLMARVVDLIVERFPGIYHAQIFLIDSDREYAIVRASTGEIGKQLIERGHRLPVGSISVIGQVAEQGRYILARDTAVSQVHRRNEFLPDTRAELAIPLRVGAEVIGALDVQSKQPDAFVEDLINVLQTMADQIAVAIQNARLHEESLRRVAEIEVTNRQATLRAWQEYMRDQRLSELAADAGVATSTDLSQLRRKALEQGRLVVGEVTERETIPIAVPIGLRGHTLGAVEWELPAQGFGEDKLELARELANRFALSLDNARLFQESRRAIERERLVNTIAAKLTAQTNIDDILEIAVREVGQALRAPQVSIRLHTQSPHGNGNGQTHPNGNGEV